MSAVEATKKPRIAVVYYSMYGHITTMAEKVAEGARAAGAEVDIRRIPETLDAETLKKMGAAPKVADHKEWSRDADDVCSYDGYLFGIPTRFGMMPAQMKAWFDSTGGIWSKGGFVGKPAGVFFSTATLGGGQETTALTAITQLTHHGFAFVPIGYSSPLLFSLDEIHGGSPYGAGTLAGGDGSRKPSELELKVAEHQGKYFAGFAAALAAGRALVAADDKKKDAKAE
jgi:NAD(P)H dehydrogenase (quinone)